MKKKNYNNNENRIIVQQKVKDLVFLLTTIFSFPQHGFLILIKNYVWEVSTMRSCKELSNSLT